MKKNTLFAIMLTSVSLMMGNGIAMKAMTKPEIAQQKNPIDNDEEDLPIQLIGNFSGQGIDTLISEPIDPLSVSTFEDDVFANRHYKWRIRSVSGKLKEVIIENTISVCFVNEGDLDGDGADEWGYYTDWPTSNWHNYHVLTYKNDHWMWLVEPFTVFAYWDMESEDQAKVVRKGKHKGTVIIGESKWINEDITTVYRTVKVQPTEITF